MNSSCSYDTKKEVAFGDGGVEEEVVWNIEVSQNPGRYSLVIWGCTPLSLPGHFDSVKFCTKIYSSTKWWLYSLYLCTRARIMWQLFFFYWILNNLENLVRKLCQKAFHQSSNFASKKKPWMILHWILQARHTQVNLCWIAVPRPLWCTGCQYICQILSKWAPCPPHCPTYPAQIGTDTRAQRSRTILIFAYSAEQSSITLPFI